MTTAGKLPVEGGCSCGAARYQITARPIYVHCCHCTWCQRETGAAFAVNALIEASCVSLLAGHLVATEIPSVSRNGQVLHRCRQCQGVVWSNYAGAGDKVNFIRVGTLDDSSAVPPDIHIYTSTKLPWVVLPDGVPAVAEYYRRSDYWPAASIARYKAARGT